MKLIVNLFRAFVMAIVYGTLAALLLAGVVQCAKAEETTYTVRAGETLTEIVTRQHYNTTLEQALVGVFQANPQAFAGSNMNRLLKGAALKLNHIALVPQDAARRTVQDQYDAFLHGQSPRQKAADTIRVAREYQIEKQSEYDKTIPRGYFFSPRPVILIDEVCLALAVYYEARGDVPEGRLAVAWVAKNRAKVAGTTICYEVFKPWQFSWTADPNVWKGLPIDGAWLSALETASIVMEEGALDFTRGANHFHTLDTRPVWSTRMPSVGVYGAHIFYRAGR